MSMLCTRTSNKLWHTNFDQAGVSSCLTCLARWRLTFLQNWVRHIGTQMSRQNKSHFVQLGVIFLWLHSTHTHRIIIYLVLNACPPTQHIFPRPIISLFVISGELQEPLISIGNKNTNKSYSRGESYSNITVKKKTATKEKCSRRKSSPFFVL